MSFTKEKAITIFIIDHYAILRAGLCMLINSHPRMQVIGEAGNAQEALASLPQLQPDILLLHIYQDGEMSLSLLSQIRDFTDRTKILVLTEADRTEFHQRAVKLGVIGLVYKEQDSTILLKAIEKVFAGEAWLDRSITATVLSEMSRGKDARSTDPEVLKIESLTEREKDVIALVGKGLHNKQIAAQLFISEKTVRYHLTSIFSKLEISDRFELALYAYRNGLAQIPQ